MAGSLRGGELDAVSVEFLLGTGQFVVGGLECAESGAFGGGW